MAAEGGPYEGVPGKRSGSPSGERAPKQQKPNKATASGDQITKEDDDSSEDEDKESGVQKQPVFHALLAPGANTFLWQPKPKPTSHQLSNQLEGLKAQHQAEIQVLLDAFIQDPSLINHQNIQALAQQQ